MSDNIFKAMSPPTIASPIIAPPIISPPIIASPTIAVDPINGCINRNFCSSMLFLAPAIYAYLVNYSKVMWCSLLCFLTSKLHHYYQANNKVLQIIDILCVNSIAAYFLVHCFTTIGFTFYATIVYGLAIVALAFYFYLFFKPPSLYEKYHCIVHILSVTGIMFYIKAYTEFQRKK
jgi:hypothetical protein